MLDKWFKFSLVGAVALVMAAAVVSIIRMPNSALAAPQSVHSLKVFVRDLESLESSVNSWFAAQQNIVVDSLNVTEYNGGGYLIVIGYRLGGADNSATRLKLIRGENPEADAQIFLSSLDPSQTVRSISAATGYFSGPQTTITVPIIFIVYE